MKTVHSAQYGKTIAGLLSTLHHFLVPRLLSNTRCLLIFVKPRSLLSSRLQRITHLANIHCCALLLFIVVTIARILWFINNAYLTLVFVLFYIISLESIGLMKREKKKTCTKVSIISFVFRRTTYGKRIYFQCVTHFVYFLVWKLKLISFRFRFSGTETTYSKNDLSQYT